MRAANALLATTTVGIFFLWQKMAQAHPLCYYDDKPTDPDMVLTFCPAQKEGACCNTAEEEAAVALYNSKGTLSTACAALYKQVACGPCSAYAAHLYEDLGAELGPEDGMAMKSSFCEELVATCEGQITFPTYSGVSYCDKHTGGGSDKIWSYPIDPSVTDFTSSGLVDAFENLSTFPTKLIAMHMTPDGSKWWLAGQAGQIYEATSTNPTTSTLVLDLSSDMELLVAYEEGLLDFAFSPIFHVNGYFYCSYTVISGVERKNRLSRFTYTLGNTGTTKSSVEVLVTSEAKFNSIHSGGWVGFQPSAYKSPTSSSHDLYWAIGDGGPQMDLYNHGQDISNLLGTIVRISVPSTVGSEGYTVPSSNVQGGRPEICAYGFRNPFRCAFDKETDELYCGDVGHTFVEEIDLVQCGKNYGWSIFEGSRCQQAQESRIGSCAGKSRTGFEFPIFEYCHSSYDDGASGESTYTAGVDICGTRSVVGNSVIGGHVYRGELFGEVLDGALLFADYQNKNIYYLRKEGSEWTPGAIISDGTASVISFSEDNNGEIYVISSERKPYKLPCGNLCSSTCLAQSDDPPTYTSLGCVKDVIADRALTLKQAAPCEDGDKNAMSPALCASYCATIPGAVYSGVQFGYECFCGKSTDDYDKHGTLGMDKCATLCVGTSTETCGGYMAMEVFSLETTTEYSYVGCYGDKAARIFTGSVSVSGTNSAAECAAKCKSSEFFGTQFGKECYCSAVGNDYDKYGTASCTKPCTGLASESCGGLWAMSVYKHATLLPYAPVGCFVDSTAARTLTGTMTKSSSMTAEYCSTLCTGSKFFGTEFSNECFCGDNLSATTSKSCTMSCAGDAKELCGGNRAISVYAWSSTPSNYVGCYTDSISARVMGTMTKSTSMTNELCSTICAGKAYYGTQFGQECFCSTTTSFTKIGTSTACNYKCNGDSSQVCGGKNALSVYRQ